MDDNYLDIQSGISVIVPTFKRVDLCKVLFESLKKNLASLPSTIEGEIIVIDNSPDFEAQKIKRLCHDYDIRYYLRHISVSAKRNLGAKLAKYSLILFVDSDCEAHTDLLKEHYTCYQKSTSTVAVLGKTKFKGNQSFIWKAIKLSRFIVPFTLGNQQGSQIWGPCNNLSCRKDIFQEINGFNEDFPFKPGFEDVDLGYRLYKHGHRILVNPQALVYHTTETWNSFEQVVKRLFNYGQAEFYLYTFHPEFLYYDYPKRIALIFIMALVALLQITITRNFVWFLLPIIFLIVNLCFRLSIQSKYHSKWLSKLPYIFLVEIFNLVYEVGIISKCLQKKYLFPLTQSIIVLPETAIRIWNQQVINTWLTFAQIILTVLIMDFVENTIVKYIN